MGGFRLRGGIRRGLRLHRRLPAGVVDGIVFGIDQLPDGHHGVAVLVHVFQDGGQGFGGMEGGVVEQDDAPGLQMLCDTLEDGVGVVILPVQTIPAGNRVKARGSPIFPVQ